MDFVMATKYSDEVFKDRLLSACQASKKKTNEQVFNIMCEDYPCLTFVGFHRVWQQLIDEKYIMEKAKEGGE